MSGPNGDRERDVTRTARALFEESVESLDAATLSRLNRGRQRALEELHAGRRQPWLRWAPAAGVAAAAVLAVMLMPGPVTTLPEDPALASDFEILLETDELEMFEDLEFYAWLDGVDLDAVDDVG